MRRVHKVVWLAPFLVLFFIYICLSKSLTSSMLNLFSFNYWFLYECMNFTTWYPACIIVFLVLSNFLCDCFISQVRNVMIENIDKVLDRGDRLELLVDKSANMQGNTFRFRKQARRFRSTVWWKNVKLTYVFWAKTIFRVWTFREEHA